MNPTATRPRLRPAETLRAQAVRYLFVGGIAFAVDYALLVGLTELLAVNYLISAVVAFTAGLAVNYCLCTTFVFAGRTLADRRLEFAIFAVIGVVGLALGSPPMDGPRVARHRLSAVQARRRGCGAGVELRRPASHPVS